MRRFGIIFCLVLLLASPGVALADVGPVHVDSGGWNDEPYIAYTIADDQWQAACNPFNIDAYKQLNERQRDYLLGDADWLRYFNSVGGGEDEFDVSLFPGFTYTLPQFWMIGCDGQVYAKARQVLNQVLRGEVSDLAVDGDMTVFPGQCWLSNTNGSSFAGADGHVYQFSVNTSSGRIGMPDFIDIAVPTELIARLQAVKPDADTLAVNIRTSSNELYGALFAYSSSDVDVTYADNHNFRKIKQIHPHDGVTYARLGTIHTELYDGERINVLMNNLNATLITGGTQGEISYMSPALGVSATVTIPTAPDPDPDPPFQPTAPGTDVPTTDPPTWPSISLPDIDVDLPSVDIDWPTLAEGLDYTDLLRTIIARLESIGDILGTIDEDLSTHCQHLQRQIHEQAKYLGNLIVQGLHSDLSFLGIQIQSAYKSINSCIRDQVGWLASQLQWVLNYDSDLDELEPWLSRIWDKIGKGSYYQPDPIDDEPGFLDWLERLWEHIIGTLSEITDGALDELLVVLDDLAHRFPFSIPWDVMALLALFAHTPEPIAFTITLPDVPGLYGGVIEVDCSGWDWMAGMVRPVLLVMFAYRLAMWTPKALESLGLLGEFKRSE